MEKVIHLHAHWGSGMFGSTIMGGRLHIDDEHFWIYDFYPNKVQIDFADIDKVIYANKFIFSYVLVVLKKRSKNDTDIMFLVNPKKILRYFMDYGIRCISSKRSYFLGFRQDESEAM